MSEPERKPRPGDMVRWTRVIEGTVVEVYETAIHIREVGGEVRSLTTTGSTVEVLEPADDPSRDEIGMVRKINDPRLIVETAVKWDDDCWRALSGNGYTDEEVTGWQVMGPCPGTPAAEASPVPPQVLERVREMLANGQKMRAIKAVREVCVGLGLKDAKAYVESLPECAMAEQGVKDQLREGLGIAPLTDAGPGKRPVVPRVFRSDGPEPPADVQCLRYLNGDGTRTPYLRRADVGWVWATATSTIIVRDGNDWATAVQPGSYAEVLS